MEGGKPVCWQNRARSRHKKSQTSNLGGFILRAYELFAQNFPAWDVYLSVPAFWDGLISQVSRAATGISMPLWK